MARAAVEHLAFDEGKKKYIVEVLDPVLEEMVQAVLLHTPDSPIDFMIEWLQRRCGRHGLGAARKKSLQQVNEDLKKELRRAKGSVGEMDLAVAQDAARAVADTPVEDESEEEDDDDGPEEIPAPRVHRGPRASVSAEAYGEWNKMVVDFKPPNHPKTEEQRKRLEDTFMKSFLFSNLKKKDMDTIVLAVEEAVFEAGSRIIQEGDDGEHLYVIEKGSPECKKRMHGTDVVVKTCAAGDVFGELALLYNAPRAASVDATDRCVCWRLDRATFNHIMKEAATRKSSQHDDFLKQVSLFSSMDSYERSQLSDGLKEETYRKGDKIMTQGETGDRFYILEEGSLSAFKSDGDGQDKEVLRYDVGDYFGELALLKDQPRAATIVVTSDEAKVLWLDKKSFTRMLGPLKDILGRRADVYT